MLLFWNTDQKETCNLREIQVLDISKEDFVLEKDYKVPKKLRKICYDTKLIEKFQHVLNQLYENKGHIPKTMNSTRTSFLMIYSELLQKIYKKYGKNINYILCWNGED